MDKKIKRGQIYMANLGNDYKIGVQSGIKPVVILSNDVGNTYSPSVIVAAITSRNKTNIPTHFEIDLKYPSTVMLEQIFTVNKNDLESFIRDLTDFNFPSVALTSIGIKLLESLTKNSTSKVASSFL